MTSEPVDGFRAGLKALDADYRAHRLGQWRKAPDPSVLDGLIERAQSLVFRIEQDPAARGPGLASLQATVKQRLQALEGERRAIDGGGRWPPGDRVFGALVQSAHLVSARFSRYMAGHDPATCDMGLLAELQDELRGLHEAMARMTQGTQRAEPHREVEGARKLLARIDRTREMAGGARSRGASDARATRLASLARAQLALHEAHFDANDVLTRRPALLSRILASARDLAGQLAMLEVAARPAAEVSTETLQERITAFEGELARIQRLRVATPLADLLRALEEAADGVFDAYAAISVDKAIPPEPKLVGRMCDELHELRRQIADVARAQGSPETDDRLRQTSMRLFLLESEHTALRLASAPRVEPLVTSPRAAAGAGASPGGDALGEGPLLPMQHRILELPHAHHWSVPIVCELAETVSRDHVDEIFRALLVHHDGLRARFTRDAANTWRQHIDPVDDPRDELSLWCDVSGVPAEERERAIADVLGGMAREDRLGRGGLCRQVVFERGDGQKRLLVVLLHHLVTDMVSSYAVLFRDITDAHAQLSGGEAIALRRKGTSVRAWAQTLVQWGEQDVFASEASRWRGELERVKPTFREPTGRHGPLVHVDAPLLDEKQSAAFLGQAGVRYKAPMAKVLLAGFAHALARWTGERDVAFTWVHHGRSVAREGIDLRRTVGLVMNEVPLCASVDSGASPADGVSRFMTAYGDLGQRGVAYSTLAFYGRDEALRAVLQQHPALQIRLNYRQPVRRPARSSPIEVHRKIPARLACGCSRFGWRLYVDVGVTTGKLEAVLTGVAIDDSMLQRLAAQWQTAMLSLLS